MYARCLVFDSICYNHSILQTIYINTRYSDALFIIIRLFYFQCQFYSVWLQLVLTLSMIFDDLCSKLKFTTYDTIRDESNHQKGSRIQLGYIRNKNRKSNNLTLQKGRTDSEVNSMMTISV